MHVRVVVRLYDLLRIHTYTFQETSTGESIKLTCTFKGHPTPTIEWFKYIFGYAFTSLLSKCLHSCRDGEPIWNDRINIVTEGVVTILEIKNVTSKDAGTYRVVAKNSAGRAKHAAELTVKGKWKAFY